MTNETFDNACLRHPDVASNLRCSRCNDLICPQCMVQSPVGARCPECANIGQPTIFRATPGELISTIAIAFGGSIVLGIAFGFIAYILWKIPFGHEVGRIAIAMVIGFAGMPVGEFVRRAGKFKLDSRLRTIAALTMFMVWLVGSIVATSVFGVWNGVFMNIVSYIGLGVGVYVAMNRVRP